MKSIPPLFGLLVFTALVDWLIVRTLSRLAIFMPKSQPVISLYEGITRAGQVAITLGALLALLAIAWIVSRNIRHKDWAIASLWIGLLVLSVVFLVVPPAGWPGLAYQVILFLILLFLLHRGWVNLISPGKKVALVIPLLAISLGVLYHAAPAAYQALKLAGPPSSTVFLHQAGEALAVSSPLVLWWVYGRSASWKIWFLSALPALAFIGLRLANPSMAGILAIWSTGMTLYLPWPLYVLSLWFAAATVVVSLRRRDTAWAAILLLAAGGYAPQLSIHIFYSLLGLWILSGVQETIPEPAIEVAVDEDKGFAPRQEATS